MVNILVLFQNQECLQLIGENLLKASTKYKYMKYIILLLTIVSFGSILFGYLGTSNYPEKFIGFGVVGVFLIVIPLFSYYRWKDRKVKDYLLTKENLDKMRESQK